MRLGWIRYYIISPFTSILVCIILKLNVSFLNYPAHPLFLHIKDC